MTDERPFADLPAALVQEVLDRTQDVGSSLLAAFQEMQEHRERRRGQLLERGLLRRESELEYALIPTTCGIDGAYAVERLLATDLIAAAAVAVEGLTPPSETRFWPDPRHQVLIDTEAHDADSSTIIRAMMMGMELSLATQAPHDVVFLDGSLTTPLIFFNQALQKATEAPHLRISQFLLDNFTLYIRSYQSILQSKRSDKNWLALPKYTTRREIGRQMGWPEAYDDRAMLTSILQPGEMTRPSQLQQPDEPWHLGLDGIAPQRQMELREAVKDIQHRLAEVRVIYYRPYSWLPALRLEMAVAAAETPGRLASAIQAVKHQCGTASMMEPYPLYMADRMVKSLAAAIPTFRQITSQHMAETYQGDIGDVFMGLHGYRTEAGR